MENIMSLPSAKGWAKRIVASEAAYSLLKYGTAESRFMSVPEVADVWNSTSHKDKKRFAEHAIEGIRVLLENGASLTAADHVILEEIEDPAVRVKVKAAILHDKRSCIDSTLAEAVKDAAMSELVEAVINASPACASEMHIKAKTYKVLQNVETSLYRYKAKTPRWMTQYITALDNAIRATQAEKEKLQRKQFVNKYHGLCLPGKAQELK